MEVPFTNELRNWLIEIGYTHIFDKGADPKEDKSPYVLVPLTLLQALDYPQAQQEKIIDIKLPDVIDMANGDPFVRFVVQIPVKEFEQYIKL